MRFNDIVEFEDWPLLEPKDATLDLAEQIFPWHVQHDIDATAIGGEIGASGDSAHRREVFYLPAIAQSTGQAYDTVQRGAGQAIRETAGAHQVQHPAHTVREDLLQLGADRFVIDQRVIGPIFSQQCKPLLVACRGDNRQAFVLGQRGRGEPD